MKAAQRLTYKGGNLPLGTPLHKRPPRLETSANRALDRPVKIMLFFHKMDTMGSKDY